MASRPAPDATQAPPEPALRVNARLDASTQQQLEYITQATGKSVSHVLRESVAQYYVQLRGQGATPSRFLALAGTARSGRSDVASNIKPHLDDALAAKLGAARR